MPLLVLLLLLLLRGLVSAVPVSRSGFVARASADLALLNPPYTFPLTLDLRRRQGTQADGTHRRLLDFCCLFCCWSGGGAFPPALGLGSPPGVEGVVLWVWLPRAMMSVSLTGNRRAS